MSRELAPAFQFYACDFLSDANVQAMTLEERGAYIWLLAHCWMETTLPTEPERLARICGVSLRTFTRIWPAIERCFQHHDDGYRHGRLEVERVRQAEYREGQSDNAKARWAKVKALEAKKKGHATAVRRQCDGNALPSSVSLLPSSVPDPAAADAPLDAKAEARIPRKRPPTNDVGRFIDWWKWGYRQFRGHDYDLLEGKDPALIARLLHTFSLSRLKQMAMFLWHDEQDEWIAKTDRGIGILSTKANTIADWIAQDERKTRRPCAEAPEPGVPDAA